MYLFRKVQPQVNVVAERSKREIKGHRRTHKGRRRYRWICRSLMISSEIIACLKGKLKCIK